MRLASFVTLACIGVTVVKGQQCDIENSVQRLDCYPENGSNQNQCLARGCCWKVPDTNQRFVPYCYFPRDYVGYKVLNKTETAIGATIFLQRNVPSNVDADINILRVDVVHQTNQIVRIKVIDPSTNRWEPPLPAIPAPANSDKRAYSIDLIGDKLKISRPDDATRIIASFDLGSMIYTDQFMQITNTLPSNVLYGLGEHKGRLRRSMNYTRLTFYNEDPQFPAYDERLYGTHPFYINIEEDGRSNGVWLLNSNALDVILTPAPAVTYRPVGGVLDFFVFVGPSPAAVVAQYQEMVGKPKMVPYWSLGFHLCRFGYRNTEETRQVMQRNIDAGVRLDVQWNDIDYMDERNDFTVDPVNYKDLGDFARSLHKDGRHYVVIVDPAVSGSEKPGEYPPFDRGLDYDVFVKDAQGKIAYAKVWNLKSSVFPDFTHPNATAYWSEMFTNFHKEVPIDGAWIDMNEPSNQVDGHIDEGCPYDTNIVYTPGDVALQKNTLCNTDKHHWSSHYDVHNMYGFTESVATYNALAAARPNKRPFIISRSTFSGSGYYTGHWTGDVFSSWIDLKDSVSGFLEFSFYGIPMVGVDICGFHSSTTMELCTRWQALGAFYPFSRNHNDIDVLDQDPAAMGGKVLVATKNAFYWRYKLLPYLYTLFYRAHVSGETVARPLFFNNAIDSATYDNDDQFMWGDALMVVPALYENQQNINAYFPKGIWYDLQNRTDTVDASQGGKSLTLPAYDDTIQFFMKGGHSVFYQEPGNTTTDSRTKPFGLYVFLCEKKKSSGEVFIDDGESIDSIASGQFQRVEVTATNKIISLTTVDGQQTQNKIDRIHVYGIDSAPNSVSINENNWSDFQYDAQKQLLSLYNLNSDMKMLVARIN